MAAMELKYTIHATCPISYNFLRFAMSALLLWRMPYQIRERQKDHMFWM